MKGIADEPQYFVGLLEGGAALCDVIDNHIYEQSLVRASLQQHVHLAHTCKPAFRTFQNTFYSIGLFTCGKSQSDRL